MSKRVEFTPPEGLTTPEGKDKGDTFESMATFRIKSDGRLCLVAIGDSKMPGYDDKEKQMYRNEGKEVSERYRESMM